MKKPLVLIAAENSELAEQSPVKSLGTYFEYTPVISINKVWAVLLKKHPDMVVFLLQGDAIDCVEVCKKMKEDARTMHVPVVVIGPDISNEQYIKCLGAGVTDYFTLPVNTEILLCRMQNILTRQITLQKKLIKQVVPKYTELTVISPDEKFIQHAMQIVEQNLMNPGFSVEELSRALHMSRVAAYKKIFSLTGKAPIDFIRAARMQRAVQLLEKSDMSIAEIAYEVGFNNPKYFSQFFKKEFAMPPSAFLRKRRA
jgi:AraC-like DNA-binding protein/CheY-like chemotaxis protein